MMKIRISTYTVLLAVVLLASCAQEELVSDVPTSEGSSIFFRSHLPGIVETRGSVMTDNTLKECHVTCFNPTGTPDIDPETGAMKPYFDDCRFIKKGNECFISYDTVVKWPGTDDKLSFFAYYPAVDSMRKNIIKDNIDRDEIKREYFKLVNNCTPASAGGKPTLDYRLEGFHVADDIANQVDFIAAYATGDLKENGDSGIEIDFNHQLARVELSAWCGSDLYNIEIAGVRIGNPLTEGDFSFTPLVTSSNILGEYPSQKLGEWTNTTQGTVEHIFSEGEEIVVLRKREGNHPDKDHSASIMGNSGPAMVIPMAEKIEKWEGKKDPNIGNDDYSTDKLYFSVLLRVSNNANQTMYPYPDKHDSIPEVLLAIGEDGRVIRRVYESEGEYYTSEKDKGDEEFKYTPDETEEIRSYCWASLPVGAKWEAGKIYAYKLNYSSGIGWHDPADPNPGEPIISDKVLIDVEVADWMEGASTEVTVPRK
ncbi:MAG: fimbrillin family protein [Muribaculaceae bacterium]|nr:fimbrillin family protein [Muribaculaceae bacterium]